MERMPKVKGIEYMRFDSLHLNADEEGPCSVQKLQKNKGTHTENGKKAGRTGISYLFSPKIMLR